MHLKLFNLTYLIFLLPELLDIVENCPEECETLVSRIIHILTDKVRFFLLIHISLITDTQFSLLSAFLC